MPNEWRLTEAEHVDLLLGCRGKGAWAACQSAENAQARKLLDEMWTHIETLVMWNIDEGATGHAVAELDRIRAEVYAETARTRR